MKLNTCERGGNRSDAFAEAAMQPKVHSPVSRLLRADITLDAPALNAGDLLEMSHER
jgi:hypothetical protein